MHPEDIKELESIAYDLRRNASEARRRGEAARRRREKLIQLRREYMDARKEEEEALEQYIQTNDNFNEMMYHLQRSLNAHEKREAAINSIRSYL